MKKKTELSRRELGKLGLAAWSGALAGALVGWGAAPATAAVGAGAGGQGAGKQGAGGGQRGAAESRWLKEPHLCCGLNTCKGKGKGGGNDCAGRGSCAAVAAHTCGGLNECAGQGPSGDNSCKGKGACAVPLDGSSWKKARTNFEEAMARAGRKLGPPPKGCPAS